jgi:hypothetical protein
MWCVLERVGGARAEKVVFWSGRRWGVGEVRGQRKGWEAITNAVTRTSREGCTGGDGGRVLHLRIETFSGSHAYVTSANMQMAVATRRRRHHHHWSPSPAAPRSLTNTLHSHNGYAASCGPAIGRRRALCGLFPSCRAHLCLDGTAGEGSCGGEPGDAKHAGALDLSGCGGINISDCVRSTLPVIPWASSKLPSSTRPTNTRRRARRSTSMDSTSCRVCPNTSSSAYPRSA